MTENDVTHALRLIHRVMPRGPEEEQAWWALYGLLKDAQRARSSEGALMS